MGRKTQQNKYYSDEKWEKINPNNKKLFEEFMIYCRSTDKSPDTQEVYFSNLRIFFIWMMECCDNKDFIDIEKKNILFFQDWMMNTQNLSSNRIRQLKSTVSSLSNYICDMLDREHPNFKNIVNKVKPPVQIDIREKTVFTNEQIDYLLKALVDKKKYMQACLVACLAGSGVRKGEIVQFKINFFDDDKYEKESGFYITPEIRCKGAGRVGKRLPRFVIKDIMYPYFELWTEERKRLGVDNEYLFVTKRNGAYKPVEKSTVNSMMLTFSKILDTSAYSHAFRHYSATWLKRNGVETSKIRDFLGHNDSSTTELYIDIGKEENLKDMLDFMKKPKDE